MLVPEGNGGNNLGVVNMLGGNMFLGLSLDISNNANSVGIVNLNGGTITALNAGNRAGALSVFNFNGGTLKALPLSNGNAFLNRFVAFTDTYIFGNGGVIDNSGATISIPAVLIAPTGNGVSNVIASGSTTTASTVGTGSTFIALSSTAGLVAGMTVFTAAGVPTGTTIASVNGTGVQLSSATNLSISSGTAINFNFAGFIDTPVVTISSPGTTGGAFPATAIANIDSNGVLTGITITSPGNNYTANATITISSGGGLTVAGVSLPVSNTSLAVNGSTGGLTFVGSGTTNLTGGGTKTYWGDTVVNGGTLLANNNALAVNSVEAASIAVASSLPPAMVLPSRVSTIRRPPPPGPSRASAPLRLTHSVPPLIPSAARWLWPT